MPPALAGFRAIFSAFHHFPPAMAEALLRVPDEDAKVREYAAFVEDLRKIKALAA